MANLLLQQTDVDLQGASECGVIAACATGTISTETIEQLLTEGGVPGVAEQTVALPALAARLAVFCQSADGVPGKATWEAGDWVIRFNITTAQMDTRLTGIWICRVNASCGVVATIASETGINLDIAGGGVISRTLAGAENTGTDSDEIYIVVELDNLNDHTSRLVGITPDQIIDTPIVVAANTTMTADPASYALTGQTVGLKAAYNVAASAGVYTLTGQTVGLKAAYNVLAESTAYVYTAQDVTTIAPAVGETLIADAAVYTYTAQDVGLRADYKIASESAVYSLTAQVVGLKAAYRVSADSGTYVYSAKDVTTIAPGGVIGGVVFKRSRKWHRTWRV